MYTAEIRAAANFIDKLEFGVLLSEVYKFVLKRFSIYKLSNGLRGKLRRFLLESKNFSRSGEWRSFAQGLLQPGAGSMSSFLSGKSTRKKRQFLAAAINNSTQLLAKNDIGNSARIFFEIEEEFEKMLKRGNVAKGCGYRVLKLFLISEPLTTQEIMLELGYVRPITAQGWYQEKVLNPLKTLRFIKEENKKFQLSEEAIKAFELMKEKREKMRSFEYRIKFFYPYEK